MRNNISKFAKWVSVLMFAVGFSGVANALGTDAGTTVSNTFTLDYEVAGTSQPTIDNTANPTLFTVDRLVDLTVTALDPSQDVAPNSVDNVTSFRLTNLGNDNQAYDLGVVTSTETGTDYLPGNVDISYFVDLDNDGVRDPTETLVAYTPGTETVDVAPDQNVIIFVESDVPAGTEDGQIADFILTADTLYPVTSLDAACNTASECIPGDEVLADADATNDLVNIAENYLNDAAGDTDVASAGDHSDTARMVVVAPTLDASKIVAVLASDPGSDAACGALSAPISAAEYSVPGACVLYTIELENTGTGAASALDIQDQLPPEVRFVAAALDTTTAVGFANEPTVAGAGPNLTAPAAPVDCTGSNCLIQLEDARLEGGEVGLINIWAIVQ